MKDTRPSLLILFGSLVFTAISFLFTLAVHLYFDNLSSWLLVVIPIISGGAAYLIFYILLRNFIHNRLYLIYRSIQMSHKQNMPKNESIDKLILKAEENVKEWKKNKNLEINRLQEQEAFRREFLGNLAHELKTPVFSIQGYLLTLLDGGLEDPEVNRNFLERAAKATDRMADILTDLDKITKLEVDELKIEKRPFDIVELVQEIFDTLELKASEKEMKLKFNKFYTPIFVLADRPKIGQVFTNLISNSIFYGNPQGLTIVSFEVFDDLITVEVTDNGPGIDEKHLPRLFERFYRVEKSRNRNEGGSGLGLAIVKHLLESHGQSIAVSSQVGKGTSFRFSLEKSSANVLLSSRGLPIK